MLFPLISNKLHHFVYVGRDNIAVAFQIQESETNGVERQYFWNFYPYFSVFLSLNEKKLPTDFVCIIKRYKFAVN